MKLPNKNRAHIPRPKLTDYLLSLTHPVGGSKARFFRAFGFDLSNVNLLEQGLFAVLEHEVSEESVSDYGTKYSVDGPLATPEGGVVNVRTVWIIEDEVPKFVTAYPLPRKE